MQKNKTTYFWLCSYPLEMESVALPGNWGRIIALYANNPDYIYRREAIFERIRKRTFPNRPSRLTSIFLCPSQKEAEYFKSATNRDFDICYEVKLIDDKPISKLDWSIIQPEDKSSVQEIEAHAQKYWQANKIEHPEIVTESRVKIIRRCD